jgi:Sulfotransferase family
MTNDHQFIFLAGLHRSGTSLLHEILREHPQISGISGTDAPENEGQHLQTVYKPGIAFGGPGKFAFDPASHMDEHHALATPENAQALFEQWQPYFDLSRRHLIEKSPPTLVRTRFFQKLYPNSKFIVILRHPIAVSYATQKWAGTTIRELLDHSLLAYEKFLADMPKLHAVYVLRYEDFVQKPQQTLDAIYNFLELESVPITHTVKTDVNGKYFKMWEEEKNKPLNRLLYNFRFKSLETRCRRFGYSLDAEAGLQNVDWLGVHRQT